MEKIAGGVSTFGLRLLKCPQRKILEEFHLTTLCFPDSDRSQCADLRVKLLMGGS
jgi:hypothetical protein